jgi:transcriptional activator SPT8
MAAAPHSSHVHAMALSLDGQTLLTGGSDGFVRKYDVHATMNGKTMLTQNVRHGFVEGITRGGTLSAFWPHEEHPPTNGIASSSFPSASVAEKDRLVGVVHSLALQQDALWGVSGSESGNIHLYTLRHDPGVARHVFRKHKGAVSALALTEDETGMISGGWDRGVHQWDLNTGQIVRSFPGHAGQISGLSFRPHAPASARSPSPRQLNVSIHPSAAESSTEKQPQDADDAGDAQRHAEQVKEAPGDAPTGQDADEQVAQSRPGEAQSKAAADSEQGDAGADADAASKSVTADAPAPEASAQDITTSAGDAPPQSAEASHPTTRPEPASDAAATDSAAKSASPGPSEATRVKTEPDPSAPSSSLGGGAADDPTEEELAFEAELNASLGMALDGSGGPRADGTRPDRVTLGANGTTAGGLMVAGADEDLDDDAGDDDLFGGSTPPVSAAKDARESARNGRDESDGDDSLFGDGDEDADGDADADADMDAEADADADEDGDDADGSSDEDMPLAGRAMVKNASSQSTLVAESESVPLSLPSSTVKDVKVSSPTAAVPDAGPKKTLPQPAFGGFSVSSSYSAPISSFSPSVMLSTSLSGQAILWDLRCPSYVTDGEARGVHSLGLPSKVPPWCQSAVFSSDGGSVFVGRRNECVDHWDLRSPKLVNTLRLPSGSGPVYALAAMPNSRHIVCGSYDNVRLWDTADTAQGKVPFKIVAGHHGANLSSVLVDSSCKFLLTASGDRGWMGTSTEAVIIHDIKPL